MCVPASGRSWRFAAAIGKCNLGAGMPATPTFDGPTRAEGLAPPLSIGRSRGLLARAGTVDATLACEGYVLPQDRLVEH
jgi:hypothetical protein